MIQYKTSHDSIIRTRTEFLSWWDHVDGDDDNVVAAISAAADEVVNAQRVVHSYGKGVPTLR